MRVAHRQSADRPRELREQLPQRIAEILGRRAICRRCGATYKTYEDVCEADLGEQCPGAKAEAEAREQAKRALGLA